MIALGMMSGTSADGIDAVAIELGDGPRPAVRLLAHLARDYPNAVRYRILATASGAPLPIHDLATLHAALGDAYAEAAGALILKLRQVGRVPDCIAIHGQTVAHYPAERATLQIGDAARVAVLTGVPVISDLRSADIAAGGEGAPLVPFADHILFADGTPRVLLNLGGIANLTLLPSERAEDVIAFDTGPANMVLDQLARKSGQERDEDGVGAARGTVVPTALAAALAHPYLARRAPKSTGREDFGNAFVQALLQDVRQAGGSLDDALATAAALTAESIALGLERETPDGISWTELVVAGGGALNPTLLARVAERIGLPVRTTADFGIPVEAREAVAFAILGAFRLRELPNTLPRCTGASRAVSAGAVHRP
ncbi:MAG TPA: anhydro-N-acetylmuramic acid kinase [Candidatus Saccharimonadales bacterium]|nr:anhydro-N-acetylmuramic acid kinase [Candidatus Saccharimonadales bacterium]